jgi:hypothetical protein
MGGIRIERGISYLKIEHDGFVFKLVKDVFL